MSKWAPPEEKGKFTSALVGGAIGTVTTWALAGWLIETIGWDFGFYVPAILVAAFTILWYFVIFDAPRQHPTIRTEEKEFIEMTLTGITPTKVTDDFIVFFFCRVLTIMASYLRRHFHHFSV